MLIHALRNVGNVEIRVVVVGELLELGVKGLASKADFVTKIVESPNAIFGILEVMVLDEAESDSINERIH